MSTIKTTKSAAPLNVLWVDGSTVSLIHVLKTSSIKSDGNAREIKPI